MQAYLTMAAIIVVLFGAAGGSMKLFFSEKKKRREAENDLKAAEARIEKERSEVMRLERLVEKLWAINEKNKKSHAAISTGDPGADFNNSVDVLSDLSKKSGD